MVGLMRIQVFRKEGFGGAGIDALTKAAGVTNGGFYCHFKSKGEAFRTAVVRRHRGASAGYCNAESGTAARLAEVQVRGT